MASLTEQLFGSSSAAGPSTGLGEKPAAEATEAKPSAGKKKAAKKAAAGSPASAPAAAPTGLAALGAKPVDTSELFRKVAPTSAGVNPKLSKAKMSAVTGKMVEKEEKRKKHLSHKHDDQDPSEVARTVFVSNLPNSTAIRHDLEKLFRDCGAVENVRVRCLLLETPKGDKNRGRAVRVLRNELKKDDKASAVAYVIFERASSVEVALTLSGTVFKGRHITVAREGAEAKAFLPKFSVFLGNVAKDASDEDVWNYFLERGIQDVDRVRVVRDRETGVAKGFGYVGFRSSASVKRAIEVREQELCGRPLRICHVQKPKDPKLVVGTATRREMRRLKHQKAMMENGPEVAAGKKLKKKEKAAAARGDEAKTSGRRDAAAALGIDDVPSWMGTTTNARKKLPAELRALTMSDEQRKKAITEKRKANQERVREARKARDKRARGGGAGGDM